MIDNDFDASSEEKVTSVTSMYKDWFLDYASYVILERAIPALYDGMKPVQRRILHSMKELDDGRYNKVANIVGHTMQYHPHGDSSIADAIVQLGQKDLLIDMQGNWGNFFTGDRAAASRYIEARLSKFALEVLFNPKVTQWQLSYDGRKKEPIALPVRFPLLLCQGVEGIAVGLSTKILPHNFNELIDASIAYLRKRSFTLYPDFSTAGMADISDYRDGKRGGKVRIRAKIETYDKSTLVIREIPFSTTTSSLIDSILKANDKGKIKVKKIEDNTASQVEILVHLHTGVSLDQTIDALYAFTNCELSISPLACIIEDHKPKFIGVSQMLKHSTDTTVDLLKNDLQIQKASLEEQWHCACLERIFLEHKIYRTIEEQQTWQAVLDVIDSALQLHLDKLKKPISSQDILRLTEIKIKRISKFDLDKATQHILEIEQKLTKVEYHLAHIIDFTIGYFKGLKKQYGKDKPRQTQLLVFGDVQATKVVIRNTKLYLNREEGFVGTALKKDEYIGDCSDIDDVICFTQEGKMSVSKVSAKTFMGKNIIYAAVFDKSDKRKIYNVIYQDGKGGISYAKRFSVTSITRDKVYDLTQGVKGSKLYYFSANPNGEAESVTVELRQSKGVRKPKFDFDFSTQLIKNRSVKGNIVTKEAIKSVDFKAKGGSTLEARKLWYDPQIRRLNTDQKGDYLGTFSGKDKILVIQKNGYIKTILPELIAYFSTETLIVEKYNANKPISLIYWEGDKQRYYAKRFLFDCSKEEFVLSNHSDSKFLLATTAYLPRIEVSFVKERGKKALSNQIIILSDLVGVKTIKALGNQVSSKKIKSIIWLEPLPHIEFEQM